MEVYPNLVYTSVLLGHFGKTIPLQKKAKIPEYCLILIQVIESIQKTVYFKDIC